MRIAVTLLALLGVPACGEPTRRGDEHFGASAVQFSARLTGPPMGYQAGDFLQPGLENVARGGGGSRGNDRFRPETFPHAFVVEFTTPPIPGVTAIGDEVTVHYDQLFYVRVEPIYSPFSPGIWKPSKASSIDTWIGYTDKPRRSFPLGPAGPPLDLPAGFSLIRRRCSPGQLNQLSFIPPTEVIVVEPLVEDSVENEYRSRCGAPLLPPGQRTSAGD